MGVSGFIVVFLHILHIHRLISDHIRTSE